MLNFEAEEKTKKLSTAAPEISTEHIKPLIKWTGGKYREFKFFSQYIPKSFERYLEPFVGGGGVFFALQPNGEVYLNDKSADLVAFYNSLDDPSFKVEALRYIDNWEKILPLVNEIMFELSAIFVMYRNGSYEDDELKTIIYDLVDDSFEQNNWDLSPEFYLDNQAFRLEVQKNILSKFIRIDRIEKAENKVFTEDVLRDHIETAFKSGFYIHFRSILNLIKTGKLKGISQAKQVANWFIVRELCYGSMFRYNSDGEFNIPYGGIAYNSKNLRAKANSLFAEETKYLLRNTQFSNLDFEEFINEVKPAENDFIFLDPPYDSDFSEYDNMAFSKADHERLANKLFSLDAKWMLVIKKTPFINGLYRKQKGLKIKTFDKSYAYNVRGRNSRDAEHLIIRNY